MDNEKSNCFARIINISFFNNISKPSEGKNHSLELAIG